MGERQLELGGARLRNLLAALLLAGGEAVPVSRLVDVLWDGSPPRTAQAALQGLISQLRRLLDPGDGSPSPVVFRPSGYSLDVASGDLDVRDFQRLAESGRVALAAGRLDEAAGLLDDALALWRGPALGGVTADALLQVTRRAWRRAGWPRSRIARTCTWLRAGIPTWCRSSGSWWRSSRFASGCAVS